MNFQNSFTGNLFYGIVAKTSTDIWLAALDNYLQWVDAGGTLWVEVHAYGGYSLEAKIHNMRLYFG